MWNFFLWTSSAKKKVTRFSAELFCFLTLLNKGDIALTDRTCNT